MEKFLTVILIMFVFTNIFLKYINFTLPDKFKLFFEKNFPFVLDILILMIGCMIFFSIAGIDLNIKGTKTLEKVIKIEGNSFF